MKYDFTTIMDRHGMDSIAVDMPGVFGAADFTETKPGFSDIPMWVADMNFPVVPTIQKAMIERINHPAFGYFEPREEYFDSIMKWQQTRNHVTGLQREHIGYENGVLGGVVSALRVLCSEGDSILLHSPTYIGFTRTLKNNGFHIVHSNLIQDENDTWRMDYEDMEKKIQENKIHTAIICSPHNPTGRVWEKEELQKAMKVFERNGVFVISDEIWSDIIIGEKKHTPTQSVSDYARNHTVAIYAPSKTFNLAGLIGSYHIIYDKWLRDRVDKQSSLCHYNEMNMLSMYALIGAYKQEGYEWTDELCQVIGENVSYAYDFIKTHFKGVTLSRPEGTYMLFLDCTQWCKEHNKSLDELLKTGHAVGVHWQNGRLFNGEYSVRINLASPKSVIIEAFDRLDRYVFNS